MDTETLTVDLVWRAPGYIRAECKSERMMVIGKSHAQASVTATKVIAELRRLRGNADPYSIRWRRVYDPAPLAASHGATP